MKRRWLVASIFTVTLVGMTGTFAAFDLYVGKVAKEIMSAVLRSEAAAIQQGNLLHSIAKLQPSVEASESLRAIAVFDTEIDPKLKFPLISLGELPSQKLDTIHGDMARVGLFDRLYFRRIDLGKVLVFYFEPRLVLWSYILSCTILALFSASVAFLGQQFESVRGKERAETFHAISKQISHDIRSPVGALKIIASMVEKKGMDPSLLKSALQRIEEIVDDLRVQSDTLDSLFNSHDLFRVDLALKQVVSEKLVEHPLRMISAQKVTRCFAAGSESQFKRVVSNLLNNAIEASHEDQPINIDLKCDGGRIILRVRDRGCGIPEEHKARLFTKGFTLGKASGSGLGLYHARRVVSAMGGGIELSPAEGGGTEVTLALRSAH